MLKTLGGIKHHWRPVYNQSAFGTTNNSSYVVVLDITGRGKIAVFTTNYGWAADDFYAEIQIDGGATFNFRGRTNINIIRGDFHFNKSIRVRHKTSTQIIRTDVAYWRI